MGDNKLLKEIARKLEWRRVEHRCDFTTGSVSSPFSVCPLCGGVETSEYNSIEELHNDRRFHKGHFSDCLFSKIETAVKA